MDAEILTQKPAHTGNRSLVDLLVARSTDELGAGHS